jgi:aspartate/methionine/tyrosine aminotransferase
MKGPSSGERATQTRYNLMQMAAGMKDVVRLGAGDPDLPTPPEIIGEAIHRMSQKEGSICIRGLDSLRQALAEHFRDEKGLDYDPDSEILITNGAQEGLFLTLLALVNPGDGVLVQDPRYSSYDQAVEAAGGTIIQVPTGRDYNFALEPEDLRKHAKNGKLLVFVNPNNPTASLVSAPKVREIAAVAREKGLFVISDEVYDKLVFDDVEVASVAECEGMREQTVILSSVSKTYAMTGFRVGYLLGPSWFIDAATRLKKVISGWSPLFSQYAALSALTGSQVSRQQILGIFTARRKAMMEGLDSLGIRYGHPGAGFFIWADISRFAVPADDFCRRLLLEARVLMFPGTSFGERWKDYVRISILEPVERIAEGIERMRTFAEVY